MYSLDLTSTDACNYNCDYCFEHLDTHNPKYLDTNYELLFRRIDELLNSNFFKLNFQVLGLNFWGGEPTLNPKFIETVFEKYKSDDRVRFMMYTNGWKFTQLFEIGNSVKNVFVHGHPKFVIQVSYDGEPIHDIFRTKKDGTLTSSIVRNNIIKLEEADIPYSIKATVTPDVFKYLHLCYNDIVEIYHMGRMDKWKNPAFFPTVDYYHIHKYTDEDFKRFLSELEDSLVKIAIEDIKFQKEFRRFFFAWFNPGRAICSAGKDLTVLDLDGKVYKCHGCLYSEDKSDHFVTSIEDNDFVNKLEASHSFHSKLMNVQPTKCQKCTVPYCLKCNSAKYSKSNKEKYADRWIDYTIEPRLCNVFHVNEKIVLALKKIIG
jgi:radical SAM protein with 4Fe4S-binding SPASM domain